MQLECTQQLFSKKIVKKNKILKYSFIRFSAKPLVLSVRAANLGKGKKSLKIESNIFDS